MGKISHGIARRIPSHYIVVQACCNIRTVDNLSYYNCHADYFGSMSSSNILNYYDDGAGLIMMGCRTLQIVQVFNNFLFIIGKGKGHHITGHEGPRRGVEV
jgi:hypothetical protein